MTYRTMAWHYHKKQEQINATCIHYEKLREEGYDLAKSNDFLDYLTMLSIGNSDNDAEKKQFDEYLLEEKFDVNRIYKGIVVPSCVSAFCGAFLLLNFVSYSVRSFPVCSGKDLFMFYTLYQE